MGSAATVEMAGKGASEACSMERLLIEDIRDFCERCEPLIKHGYNNMIRGKPTPAMLEAHRRELQWSLRVARLFRRATSADDFGDIALAKVLESLLRQLEEHWKYIYEPSSLEEADKLNQLIRQTFPDESRA